MKKLPEAFARQYGPGCTESPVSMFGILVDDLDRDDLLATVKFLAASMQRERDDKVQTLNHLKDISEKPALAIDVEY